MMTRPFRFGVNHVTLEQAEWLDTARKAEALGYDTCRRRLWNSWPRGAA